MASLNFINARLPRIQMPLLIASDMLPEEWWRNEGLTSWTARCATLYGPIPIVAQGQSVAQTRTNLQPRYTGLSPVARAWLHASHECFLDPNAGVEATKYTFAREYERCLEAVAAEEAGHYAKAESVVRSVVAIGLIILLFQLVVVVVITIIDKVPALWWLSLGVICVTCLTGLVSLAAAARTIHQGLTSTYGKRPVSLLQVLGRSLHTVCNNPGWTWILIVFGLAACTTVLLYYSSA